MAGDEGNRQCWRRLLAGSVWTRIFHVRPHSIGLTRFYLVKILFLEKSESSLILFYLKGEIKQERKPKKSDSIVFGKTCLLKTLV